MRSQIISHRGGTFLWPENSLQAFRQTLALPVEQAECDVHLAADGVPVVIHDATLDRTTEASGPVAERNAAELARVRLRGAGGETVPTLAQLAALFAPAGMRLRVEIKADAARRPYPEVLPRVLEALDAAGLRARSTIICFQAELVAAAMAAGGLEGAVWLVEAATVRDVGLPGIIAAARDQGFTAVDAHVSVADAHWVGALAEAGLGSGVWGANHAATIRRALDLGVGAFATDDPPLALALREQA